MLRLMCVITAAATAVAASAASTGAVAASAIPCRHGAKTILAIRFVITAVILIGNSEEDPCRN